MMAEALADTAVVALAEDVDFSLGEAFPAAANTTTDDFDFELGAGEAREAAFAEGHDVQNQEEETGFASLQEDAEIPADVDEIGYDEELDQTAGADHHDSTDSIAEAVGIDYTENADLEADSEGHPVQSVTQHGEDDVAEQPQAGEAPADIDYEFETEHNQDDADHEPRELHEHDDTAYEEQDPEDTTQQHQLIDDGFEETPQHHQLDGDDLEETPQQLQLEDDSLEDTQQQLELEDNDDQEGGEEEEVHEMSHSHDEDIDEAAEDDPANYYDEDAERHNVGQHTNESDEFRELQEQGDASYEEQGLEEQGLEQTPQQRQLEDDDQGGEEEEDHQMSHSLGEGIDEDDSAQEYDEDAENNNAGQHGESPYGSENSGIHQLQAFDQANNVDVVVSWGDEVCPLFKTPDVDDPDAFFLEDYDALDYPLSQFLQAIRSKIANYIATSDEIYIRVESLGLEFGETTTEALLSQVTFNNLLALHTTLVKNEDEGSSEIQGIRIFLNTRPNCVLRLKDLVTGASQGMGLSDLQTEHSSLDNSSVGSNEVHAEHGILPDAEYESSAEAGEVQEEGNEGDDYAVNDDEGEGAEVVMADDGSAVSENAPQDEEEQVAQDTRQGSQEADDDDDNEIEDGVDEIDFAAYNNNGEGEEEEQQAGDSTEEAVSGLLLAVQDTGPDLPTAPADEQGETAAPEDEADLLADIAGEEPHDELDLLEDISDGGEFVGQAPDEGLAEDPTNDSETVNNDDDDDDFFDLGGDLGNGAAATATLETNGTGASAVEEAADSSLVTNTAATLNHDEIDYEDSNVNHQGGVSLDVEGADEIDWDDELKSAVAVDDEVAATATSGAASGKRTREADEADDGAALDDGQPDSKRPRTSDASA